MFHGEIKTKWLDDGVTMELLEDIYFIDSAGIKWACRAGDWVDGASIPRFFWRIIGSPLRGKYRKASVFHDVACTKKTGNTETASLMFYDAMIETGVGKVQATLMYWAVYYFGPQW
jgi:hypothetical protein